MSSNLPDTDNPSLAAFGQAGVNAVSTNQAETAGKQLWESALERASTDVGSMCCLTKAELYSFQGHIESLEAENKLLREEWERMRLELQEGMKEAIYGHRNPKESARACEHVEYRNSRAILSLKFSPYQK